MPLSAGKEREMESEQNKRMTKDAIIQELIALLNQNQQREAANNVFEVAALIDGMEKRLESVTEELANVRRQLEKLEQEKADKTLKATIRKAVDSLERQCHRMKEQLFEIKKEVRGKASEIVAEIKRKGKAALHKVSEFFDIQEKLESMRGNIRKSIAETEHTIEKIDAFGGGMREAGQKIANTFRSFVDKETVDYSNKEKRFSKTELAKKPFVIQKSLYESMERHLDATIERVYRLAETVKMDRKQDQSELSMKESGTQLPDGAQKLLAAGMVAEQGYEYGADAFEAFRQVVKTDGMVSEGIKIQEKKEKSR